MKVKRIIAFLLVVSILTLSLTSCTKDAGELLERAESALADKPYTVDVEINYRCNDSEIREIFNQIGTTETKLYYKDGNVMASSSISIDVENERYGFNYLYTVIDDVLYLSQSYTVGSFTNTSKTKALIDEERRATLISDLMAVGGVSASDFSSVTVAKIDGERVVLCTGISEEMQISLEKAIISQLENTAQSVKATDIEMRIEFDGKRYDSITVDCDYEIVFDGNRYQLGMTVEFDFDYDEYFDIVIPADVSEYESRDIDQII